MHGYQGRVQVGYKRYRSRFYADAKHGGSGEARRLALEWLEEQGEPYGDLIANGRRGTSRKGIRMPARRSS